MTAITNMSKINEEKRIEDEDPISEYIETPWTIIGSYFKDQHLKQLVRHQIESYNLFINYQIKKTIDMFNPVTISSEQSYDETSGKNSLEVKIDFENFQIHHPQIHENNGATKLMFPQEARLRNFTYSSNMTLDLNIKYIIRNGENLENIQIVHKKLPQIHIGKLPVMLKSSICLLSQYNHISHNITGECEFDAGGYFIINGSEKTVLGQERAAENKIYCYNISKNNTKWKWQAELKSVPDFKCISPKQINMTISNKNNGYGHSIHIQIPRMKNTIPIFTLFRALGVISDKDICKYVCLNIENENEKNILNFLQASIIESNHILSEEDALQFITSQVMYTPINMDHEKGVKKKKEFAIEVLTNDLFPHCHNKEINPQDDRDSYLNKRIDLT